jgi:hypothetical protein
VALLAGDSDLKEKARALIGAGVDVKAGEDEARAAGAAEALGALGVAVKPLGEDLTEILQDEYEEWAILTV